MAGLDLDVLGFLPGENVPLAYAEAGVLHAQCFTDLDKAAAWLGDRVDCYVTGNPALPGKAGRVKASQIATRRWLLIDIDPKKTQEDPDGLCPKARAQAVLLASDVFDFVGRRAALVDSGRGMQVWLRVENDIDRKRFGHWARTHFRREGVVIDGTHDPSRLMRLPGTVNSRTKRLAGVIDPGEPGRISRKDVAAWTKGFVEADHPDIAALDTDPPTIADRIYLQGKARVLWEQKVVLDRSKRDFMFAMELAKAGAGDPTISRLMWAMPDSKAAGRGADYWGSIMEKVRVEVAEVAADGGVVAQVRALIDATDLEALTRFLCEERTLRALARLQVADEAEWLIVREAIKTTRCMPVSVLDRSVIQTSESLLVQVDPPDDVVRVIVYGEHEAWMSCCEDGKWAYTTQAAARCHLEPRMADVKIRAALRRRWKGTNRPFQPEILPGRVWNRATAKLRVEPVEGPHETWDQMYRVVGRGADPAYKEGGARYLLYWYAIAFQFPAARIPLIFICSLLQGIGKSTPIQAVYELLLSGGYLDTTDLLLSQSGFSGELENTLFNEVSEARYNRGRAEAALQRLKKYITEPKITVRPLHQPSRVVENTTHWWFTANHADAMPIRQGDRRVSAWRMGALRPDEVMEHAEFWARLKAEAPAMMYTLLHVKLPDPVGRLWLPILDTDLKRVQTHAGRSDVDWFAEQVHGWVWLTEPEIMQSFRDTVPGSSFRRRGVLQGLSDMPEWELHEVAVKVRKHVGFVGTLKDLAAAVNYGRGPRAFGKILSRLDAADPSRITRRRAAGGQQVKVNG